MSGVLLEEVTKRYGEVVGVRDLGLEVREGEFLTLLGPSGCGKTTTLRLIAGFLHPEQGRILVGGRDVTALPPQQRGIGMVFQDYVLFPHLTVEENIGFGLRERGAPRDEIRRRVREMLELVRLPEIGGRLPRELSGGQQQRVALARAVAYAPRLLLMDEPLGALDLKLREAMQIELHRIQRALGMTTIYVTHDQEEAFSLSDRIAVLEGGRLIQVGTPRELYRAPRNQFVAHFVGKINFLRGTVLDGVGPVASVKLEDGHQIRVRAPGPLRPGASVCVAVRPEALRVWAGAPEPQPEAVPGLNRLDGVLERVRYAGNFTHLFIRITENCTLLAEVGGERAELHTGEPVRAGWAPEDTLLWQEGDAS
ncbi:MAG: ABC transporter ATP-binding protein [Deltaproteobacteria bacterium]|nr:ABC transporter ATP-binding protein [Deltaproteobacteria bacterium]MBI3077154.1 ABC transporter ATP-binding protein [Deltaproteobacteria bacterium]